MPTPSKRDSITKTLIDRYNSQRVGSTFNVQKTLNSETKGSINNANSSQGTSFQSPAGFQVGVIESQLKVVKNPNSGISKFVSNLDNRKYHR